MKRNFSSFLIGFPLVLGLSSAAVAQDVDPCKTDMGHPGNGTTVTHNQTGSISGTPWGYEI